MLTLEIVKNNFDNWRAKCQKKSRIPSYLWLQAFEMAAKYPISRVAKTLGISSSQMYKKRAKMSQQNSKKTIADFLEVPLANKLKQQANNLSNVSISKNNGSKINIQNISDQALNALFNSQ